MRGKLVLAPRAGLVTRLYIKPAGGALLRGKLVSVVR